VCRVGRYQYEDYNERFQTKQGELERANAELSDSDARRAELDTHLATKKNEIAEISTELDKARAEERKRVSTDADSDKRLEQILSKRGQHLSKQDRLVKQIRELGALPRGFEDHSKTGLKKLCVPASCNLPFVCVCRSLQWLPAAHLYSPFFR
jgi:chromosome segregation ATPase